MIAFTTHSRYRQALAYGDDLGAGKIILSVPGDIQPVPSPLFTEMRRSQEFRHQSRKPVGTVVFERGGELLFVRWQADHVEIDSPDQGALVRGAIRGQTLGLQCVVDELIDGIAGPDRPEGRYDQCSAGSLHFAPSVIQSRRVCTSSVFSAAPGGIGLTAV